MLICYQLMHFCDKEYKWYIKLIFETSFKDEKSHYLLILSPILYKFFHIHLYYFHKSLYTHLFYSHL